LSRQATSRGHKPARVARLKGRELFAAREALKRLAQRIDESVDPSTAPVETPLFMRLGLTDAAAPESAKLARWC
jgi:hypothetical protein